MGHADQGTGMGKAGRKEIGKGVSDHSLTLMVIWILDSDLSRFCLRWTRTATTVRAAMAARDRNMKMKNETPTFIVNRFNTAKIE
jgi:hypothetical protein